MKHAFYTVLTLTIIFVLNCENDYPPSIWDPNAPKGETPVITELIPPDSAYTLIDPILIKGKNFSPVPEYNFVFFKGNKALTIATSDTQLTVLAPNVAGDSLEVKIAVQGVELFSDPVFYKLKPAVAVIGNLMESQDKSYAIAVDKADNVYVSVEGKVIKKIIPDGTTSHYADVSFLYANGMKMGPNNTLYVAFAAGRLKKIVTISPDGEENDFVSLPGAPTDLDFDASSNIWTTSGKDMYLVKLDKSMTLVKTFALTLKTVRVFNDYLYTSGMEQSTGEAKIWRCPIQGETLGTEELVLDIAATSWLAGTTVNSFTFSEDGEIYLATDYSDAIFIYNMESGDYETLFPDFIKPSVYALTWGEGKFLYASQQLDAGSNIFKLYNSKKGALYYGRQL